MRRSQGGILDCTYSLRSFTSKEFSAGERRRQAGGEAGVMNTTVCRLAEHSYQCRQYSLPADDDYTLQLAPPEHLARCPTMDRW